MWGYRCAACSPCPGWVSWAATPPLRLSGCRPPTRGCGWTPVTARYYAAATPCSRCSCERMDRFPRRGIVKAPTESRVLSTVAADGPPGGRRMRYTALQLESTGGAGTYRGSRPGPTRTATVGRRLLIDSRTYDTWEDSKSAASTLLVGAQLRIRRMACDRLAVPGGAGPPIVQRCASGRPRTRVCCRPSRGSVSPMSGWRWADHGSVVGPWLPGRCVRTCPSHAGAAARTVSR
jgi:hypothetical protein